MTENEEDEMSQYPTTAEHRGVEDHVLKDDLPPLGW